MQETCYNVASRGWAGARDMLQRSIKLVGKCKRHVTTKHQVGGQVQETCYNVASSRWAGARDMLQRSIKLVGKCKRHVTT